MYYYLSIGSNVDPERSAVSIVRLLCEQFDHLALLPFCYTEPENVDTQGCFLNALAVLYSPHCKAQVKHLLNQIEEKMGRDRSDPLRSLKARTADLDIMACHQSLELELFRQQPERYVQTCLALSGDKPDLCDLGLAAHDGAATVHLDATAGDIRVVDDELESFVDWVETTFKTQ